MYFRFFLGIVIASEKGPEIIPAVIFQEYFLKTLGYAVNFLFLTH